MPTFRPHHLLVCALVVVVAQLAQHQQQHRQQFQVEVVPLSSLSVSSGVQTYATVLEVRLWCAWWRLVLAVVAVRCQLPNHF